MAVDFEKRGPLAVIKINRPEARNAVNGDVANGIEAAIDQIEEDDAIWVGILTGEPPVFCAGADLKEINAGNAGALQTKRGGFGGITTRPREKPMIAAVDGPALAAAAGGLFRLGRKIPLNIAMECALTGDPITAERAHHFGLANVLCDDGQALAEATTLADRVCANAPIAVRASRKVVLEATNADDEVGWRMSMEAMAAAMGSADF